MVVNSSNLFNGYQSTHLVEAAPKRTRSATNSEDRATFEEEQAVVLQYLESQYRHISATYIEVVEFIKREKRSNTS